MKSSETDVKDSLQNHRTAFWQKNKMLVLTYYQKKIWWQKCSTITKKANSESKLHTYVQNSRKCAHYQQAHVILEKTKVFKVVMLWKNCTLIVYYLAHRIHHPIPKLQIRIFAIFLTNLEQVLQVNFCQFFFRENAVFNSFEIGWILRSRY